MSAQELQRLAKDAGADPELKAAVAEALSKATDAASAAAALKARGYDVSEEDFKASELTDDDLDRVAGGSGFGGNPYLDEVFPEYAHA